MFSFWKIVKCYILLGIFFISVVKCIQKDYCKPSICGNIKKHTLCQFPSEDPSSRCMDYEKTIVKEADKQDILEKINSRRNKVAAGEIRSLPPAQNMLKLVWNEELEVAAQRWADQCVLQGTQEETDSCRDLEGVPVGQNVATIYGESPGLTPSVLVDLWYMELLNLNASVILNYRPSSLTNSQHYDFFTQMVWAETSSVGCGGVKFKEQTQEYDITKNKTVYRLVCNFAISGNQAGEPVYNDGISCSRCPQDYSCDTEYTALCTSPAISTEIYSHYQTKNRNNIDYLELRQSLISTLEDSFKDAKIKFDNHNGSNSTKYINDTIENNFDLISHLFEFTISVPYKTTPSTVKCKDVIAVDEFVEILKNKLHNEQVLRDILFSSKSLNVDDISDATVAAIVRKLYSENVSSTTSITTKGENINSTILADLVEAVIFRHSDRYTSTKSVRSHTNIISEVSPVKILAELGEIKSNREFTGHYFFPEEAESEDDSQSENESTEIDYDTTNFPLSEIVYEIEDLKRKQATKDFLEEILESDLMLDNSKKEEVLSTSVTRDDGDSTIPDEEMAENYDLKKSKRSVRSCKFAENKKNVCKNYNKLLQKLANDIRQLKLNERFHCCYNKCSDVVIANLTLNLILCLMFMNM